MPRPSTQALAARKLRRTNGWISADPDAAALAQQLVNIAVSIDKAMADEGAVSAELASAYLATRDALMALAPVV